jgi:hypothetical protein
MLTICRCYYENHRKGTYNFNPGARPRGSLVAQLCSDVINQLRLIHNLSKPTKVAAIAQSVFSRLKAGSSGFYSRPRQGIYSIVPREVCTQYSKGSDSRRLPTAAARVRAWVITCGIYGGERGTGERFLRVLRYPLPIIPPTAPRSSSTSSSGASTIGQ